MKKSDLLELLAEEYKKTVRLPDDISLKDYKDVIERKTGIRVSDRKATRELNALDGFTSLLVADRGKIIRVWRENVKTRNSYKPKPKRARRLSKKVSRSELASPVSI